MEYPYSIKDISSRVKKTVQSLYTLIKKNQGFINDNSQKQGRNVKYNQAVMDWFINYYGVSQEEEAAQDTSKTPQISPETASTISGEEKSLIEAKARIAVLEAENKDLRERLAKCDGTFCSDFRETREDASTAVSTKEPYSKFEGSLF